MFRNSKSGSIDPASKIFYLPARWSILVCVTSRSYKEPSVRDHYVKY